jgi:release factor glutamine methyltransferase
MPDSDGYKPMMSPERARSLRRWHDVAYENLRASLPTRISLLGLDLYVTEDVFAPSHGGGFQEAVVAEVKPTDRVLDMGTGSGVNAILAAAVSSDVLAVDVNPKAVDCAIANADRNGVSSRITFFQSDVFEGVDGAFDLIVFDPPFRWFAPRDLLEVSTADENYRALTKFMREAKDHLRPGGRILLNFGTSGDIDFLHSLVDAAGFRKEIFPYGQATRDGLTVDYYTLRLSL